MQQGFWCSLPEFTQLYGLYPIPGGIVLAAALMPSVPRLYRSVVLLVWLAAAFYAVASILIVTLAAT